MENKCIKWYSIKEKAPELGDKVVILVNDGSVCSAVYERDRHYDCMIFSHTNGEDSDYDVHPRYTEYWCYMDDLLKTIG